MCVFVSADASGRGEGGFGLHARASRTGRKNYGRKLFVRISVHTHAFACQTETRGDVVKFKGLDSSYNYYSHAHAHTNAGCSLEIPRMMCVCAGVYVRNSANGINCNRCWLIYRACIMLKLI